MSGLIRDIFGGGGSAKTDRTNQLTAFSDLKNTFNWALPFGQTAANLGTAATQQGLGQLGQAGNYYSSLLSGNRASLEQAVAPETAAAQASSDAAKRQAAASGTARGGGTAAANQTREDTTQAQIDQMLFGVRPAAAEGLAKVGSAEGGLGLGETGLGVESAELAGKTAGTLGSEAGSARATDFDINQSLVSQTSTLLGNILGAIPGLGGVSDIIGQI